jgi:uncharacterized membrane protein YqjE
MRLIACAALLNVCVLLAWCTLENNRLAAVAAAALCLLVNDKRQITTQWPAMR